MPTNNIQSSIRSLLREKRLAEAFGKLREAAKQAQNWQISDQLDELEESYRYMIRYVAEGSADPKRDEIHESIMAKLMELADMVATELTVQTSPRLYYATLRMERMHASSLHKLLDSYHAAVEKTRVFYELPADQRPAGAEESLLIGKEKTATDIFKHVWVTFPMPNDEVAALATIVNDANETAELRELVIAATILNLLEHFSEPLLLLLLNSYIHNTANDAATAMKALCGALLIMHRYRDIIAHSHQIGLRIAEIADSERGNKDIMTVFMQFIRSHGTEAVCRKVNDELVPKLMKLSPEMRRKMRDGIPDDPEEMAQNPDWQEMLDKSGIADKMQELSRMQAEGSDVFLSSFSHLKSFSFFNEIANWFLPFTPRHSSICKVFGNNALISMVDSTTAFCDSDKYSFALSMASMPEMQRTSIMSQFDEQQSQVLNEMTAEAPDQDRIRENVANKYVQNLYRFFKLFRYHAEFPNPFTQAQTINLIEVPYVCDTMNDTKSLRVIAEFYFRQQCYADALQMFAKLVAMEQPTASDFQKTGYCHEQLKDYAAATADYRKVDLMKSDDVWTLKHLALCLRAEGHLNEAIETYKRVEKLQPENVALANNIASCLLEAEHIEEALKYFFKVDYLAPKGERTMRPIAWCSFLLGNYSQSIDYYTRVIALKPNANDYINRGHSLLCSHNIKDAVANYVRATTIVPNPDVVKTLVADRHYLDEAGIDDTLISLIIDKIRYGDAS